MTDKIEPTDEQYARFGKVVAALLGAAANWDGGADFLEEIAEESEIILGFNVGSNSNNDFYRALADKLGIPYTVDQQDL